MLEKRVLEIFFEDVNKKSYNISVDDAKENIDKLAVKSFADFVIENKIFKTDKDIVSILKKALIKNTTVEELL